MGKFEGALSLSAVTFDDMFTELRDKLKGREQDKVLIYCTGGIRCEKIGAFMRQQLGFQDVNQLKGGIVHYSQTATKTPNFVNLFKGKCFSFDQRIQTGLESERVSNDCIAMCAQCMAPHDDTTNCANPSCHLLFVQCPQCRERMKGCCSHDCAAIVSLPADAQALLRRFVGRLKAFQHRAHTAQYQQMSTTPGKFLPLMVDYLRDTGFTPAMSFVESYCAEHSQQPSEVLRQVERKTQEIQPSGAHMTSGAYQASLLQFLIKATKAQTVLELGMYAINTYDVV